MNKQEEINQSEILAGTEEANAELKPETEENLRQKDADPPAKKDTLKEVLEWVRFTIAVVLVGLLITNFIVQRNTVQGDSMYPNLHDGDELIVEKVSRYFGGIRRGDIITVDTHGLDKRSPNNVIKRVVGLPGERVEIREGRVYINGEVLDEPYLPEGVVTVSDSRNPQYEKLVLADNEYYCLGDNRPNSKDSRVFGPVPRQNILGHTLVRIYPFDRFGTP